ncbi:MAG: type I secretion C-terminal target domain-containing protein, partial [Candidatus Methylumidiphilus sp.]
MFQNGDIIAIAYRGTDNLTDVISEDGDVRADRAIANPLADWTSQFDEAIKLAENIKSHNESSHIVVTGHSLGGALAQVSAKMFGFAGATFDPGGAGNITQSDQFNQWATNLVRDYHYPTSTINQSPNAAFVNYVVDHSQVSGWIGDHIGRQEQLDFFAYATTEELVIQSSTYVAHLALDKFKLAFLADAVTNALTTFSLHQMDGILDLMSIKKYDQITLELQQKYQQTIQQASDTGDVGKAGSSYGQPQTVFYSTSYNPYVFANDYDNIIYGTDGKDIIYSFAGNDKVYAGDGDDTISTAQGNDLIDAGDGSDTVYAGSGDDAVWLGVLVQGSQELADGGAGDDTLELDMTGLNLWQHFLKADNAGSPIVAQASNSWETIRAVAVAAMTGSWQLTYYNPLADGYQAVTVSNFEHVNVTGSNSDDLILFQGGTRYDGGNGTDAFYAGWSNATSNIVWNNDPTQTQTVNGVSLSGLERLLIATGSGNDTLTNLIVNTDDVFITGAGDDTVNAGGGNDRIEGGQDNNRLTGGSGTDVFTLNALGNDTITDFSKVESDQLDLATVLTQLTGYVSGNPFAPAAGYLALMQSAEGVRVLVDQDGKAGAAHTFKIIATINNLNAGALGSSQFVQGFAPTFLTNHAPAGADKTVTLAENAIYTFAVSDFGYTDPNDNPANALLRVKITTLPNAGSLKLNGVAVTVGQMVVIADINAGNLKFTPAVNASGTNYANFTFQVQDDGGTVNGGIDLDPMPNTFTFNVTANKASQTITFGAAPTIIVGGTGTISAT